MTGDATETNCRSTSITKKKTLIQHTCRLVPFLRINVVLPNYQRKKSFNGKSEDMKHNG